ncbi:MAG TPA: SDR family NAD(P)-dependent oxidoreductase [Ktedonobacterales bacterium]|jgi:3-oxoacyl-[acyl-carrier protein] reductase
MGMLDGKVAILTGSGRGIGAAAAKLFASEGASVVVCDLDPTPANETAEEIKANGGTVLVVAGDMTQESFPDRLVSSTIDAFHGLDIIVNNAGYTWDAVIHKMTDKQWQAMLDIHVTAPFRLVRAASTFIRESAKKEAEQNGRANPRKIINVSSVSGTQGNAGQANYSTAKAGVTGLTKTLAKEWGQFNVQVNCVAYGWIETRLTAAKGTVEKLERDGEQISIGIPEQMQQMGRLMVPLGRPGTPEEAAGPMLFLASPLSNYVSGIVIEVHGGRAM